jgi:hypothetical protein
VRVSLNHLPALFTCHLIAGANGTPLRGKDEGKIMKDEVKTELALASGS